MPFRASIHQNHARPAFTSTLYISSDITNDMSRENSEPVYSKVVQCERSASLIRRLGSFTRHGKGRPTSMALIHIHYGTSSMEEVEDIFAHLHPGRL